MCMMHDMFYLIIKSLLSLEEAFLIYVELRILVLWEKL